MNNISWFLYAVDVLSDLEVMLTAVGIIIIFCLIPLIIVNFPEHYNSDEENEQKKKTIKKYAPKIILAAFCICLVAILVPSSKTMYLILGSEVGEEIVTSETGKRVQDAINKKLDEYLGENQ